MGAGQSSENGPAASGQEVKTSYYELIGVHRSATDDEIKKAYRRKALALHPDRNFGNEEAATKTFSEIQAAYEVLSDPQERAWYDSHEAAILRGDDVADEAGVPSYENVRITTADDLARLVRKFNGGVEFTDAPSGFFGFVRETFEHLAQEEDIAGDWEGIEVSEYPTFGHKDDDYDDVVKRFYVTWQSFSTIKTFSWKDKYRLSEAPDRWMRRRMEQENKKLRQDGVREFNDAVRSLVAFIRKRDPRYVPSTQTEEERQKILRDAAAAQAARARAANAARLDEDAVPEWTKIREPNELEESSEEEVEQQIFECVACNKEFKSERQWEAHERSKKHQKAVYALQKKMRKENAHLDLDSANVSTGTSTPIYNADDSPVHSEDEGQSLHDDDSETEALETTARMQKENHSDADGELPPNNAHDIDSSQAHDKDDSDGKEANEGDDDGSDYAPIEEVQARLHGTTLTNHSPSPSPSESEPAEKTPAAKTLGKAAQKRARKAAAAAATAVSEPDAHQCVTCHAGFSSKTQLFQHIKKHGHAAPVSATTSGSQSKKSKSKRG